MNGIGILDPGAAGAGASVATALDFVVIGAMKSGTTSIENNFRFSPEVRLVSNFHNIRADLFGAHRNPRYAAEVERDIAAFRGEGDAALRIGHVKGDYHANSSAMDELIARPDLKLVLVYREPVSRLFSHYHHFIKQGYTTLPFEDWVTTEDGRQGVRLSSLGECIAEFSGRVTPERFVVMRMEDTSTLQGMAALAKFLGVSAPKTLPTAHHTTTMPRSIALNYRARQGIDRIFERGTLWNRRANTLRKNIFMTSRKPPKMPAALHSRWTEYFAEDFETFQRLAEPFRLCVTAS